MSIIVIGIYLAKNIFAVHGEIDSDDDNAHYFPLLVVLMKSDYSIMARLIDRKSVV